MGIDFTDGLIFDIDGTLWDSTAAAAAGYSRVLAEAAGSRGQVTGDELKQLFGRPMPEIGAALLAGSDPARYDEWFARCLAEEDAAIRELRPEPYAGVCETIPLLAEKLPLFLVSNCQGGYAETFLEVTGLEPYFEEHLCPDDTGVLKAENIGLIVQKYGLEKPYYVGDTAGDEKACREAGVPFIFAAYGFGETEAPAHTIRHFADLLDLVGG